MSRRLRLAAGAVALCALAGCGSTPNSDTSGDVAAVIKAANKLSPGSDTQNVRDALTQLQRMVTKNSSELGPRAAQLSTTIAKITTDLDTFDKTAQPASPAPSQTAEPSASPSPEPSASPSPEPTSVPSPTDQPTLEPSPTPKQTKAPRNSPSPAVSKIAVVSPSPATG